MERDEEPDIDTCRSVELQKVLEKLESSVCVRLLLGARGRGLALAAVNRAYANAWREGR